MSSHFIIQSRDSAPGGGMAAMGARKDIIAQLGTMNTTGEQPGEDVLYGPGICLIMAPGEDPLKQMMLNIVEEEIAWLVIMRMARKLNWKILDGETGEEIDVLVEEPE